MSWHASEAVGVSVEGVTRQEKIEVGTTSQVVHPQRQAVVNHAYYEPAIGTILLSRHANDEPEM